VRLTALEAAEVRLTVSRVYFEDQLNEGHGLSRAVKALALDGFSR